MIGIGERDLGLVWARADLKRLSPHGPIGIGIPVAVRFANQIVNVIVEVPVTRDVVEGVVLQGQVDNVFDLSYNQTGLEKIKV